MTKIIKGIARVDQRTKLLTRRLKPSEIAFIDHPDLDGVSAQALAESKPAAVVNASPSITGRFPNTGPSILLQNKIYILDNIGKEAFHSIKEGDFIQIAAAKIIKNKNIIATGEQLTTALLAQKLQNAQANLKDEIQKFLRNTLNYISKEQAILLEKLPIPELNTTIAGRSALIVVRGATYKEDLETISSYIKDEKPLLIGVDGGADALLQFGYQPHIIIGDMDSVSDQALSSGAELIVHAYPNSQAPGLKRIKDLGLSTKILPAPGTSEDIALLLAYEKGANPIIAVGTHSSLIDCLEKGQAGMASTFLTRLKVGSILVDAKGVSKLYRRGIKFTHIIAIILAAFIVISTIIIFSPDVQQFLKIIGIHLRNILGL